MLRLLVLADDLTGATDAGMYFAREGVSSVVQTEPVTSNFSRDQQVLVINTETRHFFPEIAAARIAGFAKTAKQLGVKLFFKKTDSTLRGNVGAELAALLETTGEKKMAFVPALPALGRTTKNGLQFVRGKPL